MDLRELYQETIVDHSRKPRNFGRLADATHNARGHNPLCGDELQVFAIVEDGVVKDLCFEGSGCAISTASASLMTEALKGKSLEHAEALFGKVHSTVTGAEHEESDSVGETVRLGKLAVLEGVRQYPMRVKCATLAWHTLRNALDGVAEDVAVTE